MWRPQQRSAVWQGECTAGKKVGGEQTFKINERFGMVVYPVT